MPEQNLSVIALKAQENAEENYRFRQWLQQVDADWLDEQVQSLNTGISRAIDCTSCGNCCRQLMINVELIDIERLSFHLGITPEVFAEQYVESSGSGEIRVMNSIPCHFLEENKCLHYQARPKECREFPGLHLPNFKARMFATFMHYGRCPIIFNVIEDLKKIVEYQDDLNRTGVNADSSGPGGLKSWQGEHQGGVSS